MTFARHKRLLLGLLAAVVPLPLPFNDALGWLPLGLYEGGVAVFLWRAHRDAQDWLPNWAMNLLGVAYLPLLWMDLGRMRFGGPVLPPLVHLAMFSLVVKLFSLRREADKWHAFGALFFLFLAAMGTSVHPAVLVYLVAAAGLFLFAMVRFAAADVISRHQSTAAPTDVPAFRFLAVGLLLALVAAVPLFALMPRLRSPVVARPTSGGGGDGGSAFQDEVTLDTIGRVRTSRGVALRFRYEAPPPAGHEPRFKARVYSVFTGTGWQRHPGASRRLEAGADGYYRLAPGAARSWMEIWLQPSLSSSVVAPVDAALLELRGVRAARGEAGEITFAAAARDAFVYRAGLLDDGAGRTVVEGLAEPVAEERAVGGSLRFADLAAEVMGAGERRAQVDRVERFFIEEFEYTLDLGDDLSDDPLETFVFETRRGHCELFASSMVLLLRSQGVPARFVTGFLGAEFNPFRDYYIVRNSHAHAWVEAWVDGAWRVYDPTPPAGRPIVAGVSVLNVLRQAYDVLLFRWDVHVLGYSFGDQVDSFLDLRRWWGRWFGDLEMPQGDSDRRSAPQENPAERPDAMGPRAGPIALLLTLVPAAIGYFLWRRRRAFDAVAAYAALRRRLMRQGAEVGLSTPPLRMGSHYARRYPHAAAPSRRIVERYLLQAFGGVPVSEEERRSLRRDLRASLRRTSGAGT